MKNHSVDPRDAEDWQWFVDAFMAPERRDRWATIFRSRRWNGLSAFDLFNDDKVVQGRAVDWDRSAQALVLEAFGATGQDTEVLAIGLGHDDGGLHHRAVASALFDMLEGVLIYRQRRIAIALSHDGDLRLFREPKAIRG
jgi:hypothetical protein